MLLTFETQQSKQVLDITPQLEYFLSQQGFAQGLCHAFVKHTTAALALAELDPGSEADYLDAFAAMVPRLRYRHPHDPEHFGDHLLSSLIGPSLLLPVAGGKLDLGVWQRVVLLELCGPREREIAINLISTHAQT